MGERVCAFLQEIERERGKGRERERERENGDERVCGVNIELDFFQRTH